jgi:hypothetical protein
VWQQSHIRQMIVRAFIKSFKIKGQRDRRQ